MTSKNAAILYLLDVNSQQQAIVKLAEVLANENLPQQLRILIYHWLSRRDNLPVVKALFEQGHIDKNLLFNECGDEVVFAEGQKLRLSQGVIYKMEDGCYYARDSSDVPASNYGYVSLFYLRLTTLMSLLGEEEHGNVTLCELTPELGQQIEADASWYQQNIVKDDPIPATMPMVLRIIYKPDGADVLKSLLADPELLHDFKCIPKETWVTPAYTDERSATWTYLHLCCGMLKQSFYEFYIKAELELFNQMADDVLTTMVELPWRKYFLLYRLVVDAHGILDKFYEENPERFLRLLKQSLSRVAYTDGNEDPNLLFWLCYFPKNKHRLKVWLWKDKTLLNGCDEAMNRKFTVQSQGRTVEVSAINNLSKDSVLKAAYDGRETRRLANSDNREGEFQVPRAKRPRQQTTPKEEAEQRDVLNGVDVNDQRRFSCS